MRGTTGPRAPNPTGTAPQETPGATTPANVTGLSGLNTDPDGGLPVHVTNFADSLNQVGGGIGGAGTATASAAGVGASVRQWATRLDFAGKEARYGPVTGLLSALAQQKSGGYAQAISRAGARGLFQFMPATEREYGINAFDPAQAADAAAKKMAGLMGRYHGNLTAALSAYNWGEGNLERRGLANAPAETRNYAPSVMARMTSLNAGAMGTTNVASLNAPMPQSAAQAPVVQVHTTCTLRAMAASRSGRRHPAA
ncbi:hypothetical protein R75461_07184 [Paraburkholderia nemoris]|uniref:lytic transglycosylase domain-containing protein n=1 Tax=Paraburkholderia nemoris TaxID=2793076 RepID=UPI00190DA66B|nr:MULTISPECIES: lytic transglycosylase domain-containing protein [Paraburkholderia]MBK3786682.1 lytic transglycosylase domain-containing protein [Paraburkholderia aspalathi]CAE6844570.1 hypothetical protein R75461_07184 [Paraburkholderia nemoris]